MKKICEDCGLEFEAKSKRQRFCNRTHYVICPICGKKSVAKNNQQLVQKYVTCSYQCRVKKTQQTSMERYGCKAPGNNPQAREKAKKTMVEKYGAEYTLQSNELKTRVEATNISKYGVSNVMQNADINAKAKETDRKNHRGKLGFNTEISYQHRRETIISKYGSESAFAQHVRRLSIQTLLENYGVEHQMQVPEFHEKQKDTLEKNYGVRNAFQSKEIRDRAEKTMVERYGVTNAAYSKELMEKADETMRNRYGKPFKYSKVNEAFANLLKSRSIEYEAEFFLEGKWFDFKITNSDILIEIDPTYTHNFYGNKWNAPYPKDYQLKKTLLANKHGYRCIHIFDWDDINKILDLFKEKESIYARKCKVEVVDKSTADKFLNAYHLQGTCKGQTVILGLIYEDELISLMSFGKARYTPKHKYELLRYCIHPDFKIIGGAEKLFSHAVKDYGIDSIISYCDRAKFNGDVYKKLGMRLIRTTPPNTIWSDGKKYITANLLKQRGYDQLFGTSYGKGTSNEQLMIAHYWLPIGDCGQFVFAYERK